MFNKSRQFLHRAHPSLIASLVSLVLVLASFANTTESAIGVNLPLSLELKNTVPESDVYKVKVEGGTRCTADGAIQQYTLYIPIPQPNSESPSGPFPGVVLLHGFLMTGDQHRNNAQYLAEHGFIVMTPNISKWLWGDDKRTRNIRDLIDAVAWFTGKTGNQPPSIRGLVDTSRYLLYLFFRDSLSAPRIGKWQQSFAEVVAEMQTDGKLVRATNLPADGKQISQH